MSAVIGKSCIEKLCPERFVARMPLTQTDPIKPVEGQRSSHALFFWPCMCGTLWWESPSSRCCVLAFSQDACLYADLLHTERGRPLRHMPPSM